MKQLLTSVLLFIGVVAKGQQYTDMTFDKNSTVIVRATVMEDPCVQKLTWIGMKIKQLTNNKWVIQIPGDGYPYEYLSNCPEFSEPGFLPSLEEAWQFNDSCIAKRTIIKWIKQHTHIPEHPKATLKS